MSREWLRAHLSSVPVLADLTGWEVTPITGGLTSPHVYRLREARRDGRDLFVKEIKANERAAWQLLLPLGLTHVQRVLYPELLSRSILVVDYVRGGPILDKGVLAESLVAEMAELQNRLNQPEVASRYLPYDGSGYGRYFLDCLEPGRRNLAQLRALGLLAAEGYVELLARLEADRDVLAREIAAMPPGWLHYDFREENILAGPPQLVVDWGSSYGYGPFLHDLAPFLIGRPGRLAVFANRSDICNYAGRTIVERWLSAATCDRLAAFLKWAPILRPPDELDGYLAYHYDTYRHLLR